MAKYLSEAGLVHLWTDILKPLFDAKVDKVVGKGLSTLDFTQAYLDRIAEAEDAVTILGSTKVDKVGGKGLSTNDLTNDLAAQYAAKANLISLTATLLASGWTGSGPYTQTVSIAELLETDTVIVDVVLSDTNETAITQLEAYGLVGRMMSGPGTLTATCYDDKPAVDLHIQLKVVR